MVVLAGATNLVTLFIGFELLSIPLYVLCATELRREHSLESGLKYLIVGSLGSAVLLYGLAMLYGATGSTDFAKIAVAAGDVEDDTLFVAAIALIVTGLAFKASVAPFHQWTPDVYEGAPTPITAFMAVATKAAAFGVLIRLFDTALISAADLWAPAFATLAVVTIIVGNVGAIGQSSVKRMLAYSSVAQAGYMLAGLVVSTRLGASALVFYLFAYTVMNLAAFAVIVARERETPYGDDLRALHGLGVERPWLAWPMTIAMLSLAGFPATAGFFGKIYLIEAAVDNQYAFLGVAIVLGSAMSLAYYLRVVAAVWLEAPEESRVPAPLGAPGARPAIAGGSQEADAELAAAPPRRGGNFAIVLVAVVCAVATVAIGIYPEPLLNVAEDAGRGAHRAALAGEALAVARHQGVDVRVGVLLREVAAVEMGIEPVEVGLPAGGVLPVRAERAAEDVGEDERGAVGVWRELEAVALGAPLPGEGVGRIDRRDPAGVAAGLERLALLGDPGDRHDEPLRELGRLADRPPDALLRVGRGGARSAAPGGRRWCPACRSSRVLLQVVFECVEPRVPVPPVRLEPVGDLGERDGAQAVVAAACRPGGRRPARRPAAP